MLTLSRLTLTDFRSYAALTWRPAARIAVLTGPNGTGKTNLLEAISLLGPGRGFGRGRMADLARRDGPGSWAVAARIEQDGATARIGTGTQPGTTADRRLFRLDGAEPRSMAEITSRVASVWLTPQMDTLFQESATGRRRFLDRLVWALEPGHAREASGHDAALAERRRVLAVAREHGTTPDPSWLDGLEQAAARHAVALSAARRGFTARLNAAAGAGAFPRARLILADPVADRLDSQPALAVEVWLAQALAERRAADAAAGTSTLGAHRADMRLLDASTGLEAAGASTGQQKAMLLGVILAHAALIAEARGSAPLLLLDEPAVHLDANRRAALWAELARLPAQVFLTGTDPDIFGALRGGAEFLTTGDGRLTPGPAP